MVHAAVTLVEFSGDVCDQPSAVAAAGGAVSMRIEEEQALTVSFHESGAYLFPGTGFVDELGDGDGYGYSVNVPLDAHTEDASFVESFEALVPLLAEHFRPDVILLQCGCDAHVLDPLTHRILRSIHVMDLDHDRHLE